MDLIWVYSGLLAIKKIDLIQSICYIILTRTLNSIRMIQEAPNSQPSAFRRLLQFLTSHVKRGIESALREPHFFEQEGILQAQDIEKWKDVLKKYWFEPSKMVTGDQVVFETQNSTYFTILEKEGFMIYCAKDEAWQVKSHEAGSAITKIIGEERCQILYLVNDHIYLNTTSPINKIRRVMHQDFS
jgi:hypothetical protein